MRVAVFVPGGLSIAGYTQGFPPLEALLNALAADVDFTIYSMYPTQPHAHWTMVSPPRWLRLGPLKALYLLLAFRWHHWRRPYELVQGFWALPGGKMALRAARWVRRPSVVTFMGAESGNLPQYNFGYLRHPNTRREVLRQYREATEVVLLSEHMQALLQQAGAQRATPPRILLFGVDPHTFTYQPGRRQAPYTLVHVGNLNPMKDQTTLLEGFARLLLKHEVQLRVLGADWTGGALAAKAEALGIADRVSFLGLLPYAEIARHLAEADALVHTSHHEGQGLIFLEAMASGTLVVSTPVGNAADLQGRATATFPAGDAAALAEVLAEVLTDGPRQERMLAEGQRWAAQHTLTQAAQAYLALYRSVSQP